MTDLRAYVLPALLKWPRKHADPPIHPPSAGAYSVPAAAATVSRPPAERPLPPIVADGLTTSLSHLNSRSSFCKRTRPCKTVSVYASSFWAFLKPSHREIAFGRDAASLRRLSDHRLALPLTALAESCAYVPKSHAARRRFPFPFRPGGSESCVSPSPSNHSLACKTLCRL